MPKGTFEICTRKHKKTLQPRNKAASQEDDVSDQENDLAHDGYLSKRMTPFTKKISTTDDSLVTQMSNFVLSPSATQADEDEDNTLAIIQILTPNKIIEKAELSQKKPELLGLDMNRPCMRQEKSLESLKEMKPWAFSTIRDDDLTLSGDDSSDGDYSSDGEIS